MTKSDHTLKQWRDQIDALDVEIIRCFSERMAIVREIGRYKKKHNIAPVILERRQAVLNQWLSESKKYNLSPEFIEKLFELLHEYAVLLQVED